MQVLAALRQAQNFLDANQASLGGINATGARKTLDETIDKIAGLAETQDSHRILVTGQRASEIRLSAELRRRFLRPIVEIARAKLPEQAELTNVTLPNAGNSTKMVSRARGLGDAVEPFKQTFIDAGLPADFVEQLRTASAAVVAAILAKGEHRSNRMGATDGLGKEVAAARKAVRMLDSLVKAQLATKEPLLTTWRGAITVIKGGPPSASKLTAPTTPTTAAPTTEALQTTTA
jgi:hypothetical protein